MPKIKVGILGATGAVGQRCVQLLDNHPYFAVTALAASDNSAGKPYAEACRWRVSADMPTWAREMVVQPCEPELDCELVFSALPGDVAGEIETTMAAAGYAVSSNASAHRMDPDVPLVVPEINPQHLGLIPLQQRQRGWARGFIVTNPNCSTIHLALPLKPLQDAFGLKKVLVTTLQAVSGAGYPGVPSLDIIDNVIPFIGGEESKVETEPLKILGQFDGVGIVMAEARISAHCNRVLTLDGHLECVSVELEQKATLDEVRAVMSGFRGEPQALNLPSAPARPVVVRDEPDRPQTRFDRDAEKGMASVVGRLRPCSILDWKFVTLGHNTIRGAAGAAILNAELLVARGYFARTLVADRLVVRLPRQFADEMIAHAGQGAPGEVCGILAVADGQVTRVYRVPNVAENPIITYKTDPQEQFRVLRELGIIGEMNGGVFGLYHSHPASPAYPSPTDVQEACWPNAINFIVSLAGAEPVIRAFNIDQAAGRIDELEVVIT
jgi:aspartate-semialdehyde dehydrogenase